MTETVEHYQRALVAYEAAQYDLIRLAANHIDLHSELDTTGEWARMYGIFGHGHRNSWDVESDDKTITFSKTTQRGLVDHEITVNLSDL